LSAGFYLYRLLGAIKSIVKGAAPLSEELLAVFNGECIIEFLGKGRGFLAAIVLDLVSVAA